MIKEGLVAMALIGCDCDAKMCEYIRTADQQWTSVAECEADIQKRVVRQQDSYPLVIAICRDTSETPVMASAGPSAQPSPTQQVQLAASSIVTEGKEGQVSTDRLGRITTVFKTLNGYVSVRDTVGSTWSSASQHALDTMSWLKTAVTPEWF
ncbi:MAG: hypothetical protein KF694_15565 [Mesorhizobium sp.]|nr:hypothetical protein [Mesorhizobium sp.]